MGFRWLYVGQELSVCPKDVEPRENDPHTQKQENLQIKEWQEGQ